MRLTYLIATYNRKDALKRHLDLLNEQTYPGLFEVIVCDDGSNDGTHEMLQEIWKNSHLTGETNSRYVLRWFNTGSTNENTVAKAKNMGIRAAKGNIIIMMDDDNLPHRQLIDSYLSKFNPQEIQLGYKSSHQSYLNTTLPVPVEPGIMTIWWKDHQASNFGHFQCGNICLSVEAARTPAKDGSIGFDERFTGYGHEDVEYGRRLYGIGYRLSFNPDAVVWHMDLDTTTQQDPNFKEIDKVRTGALLEKIMKEPWPVLAAVYPGFNNTTGMMSPGELRWLYNKASIVSSVVEIGSFAGRSTHALLSGCEGTVFCVDEWNPDFIGSKPDAENIRRSFLANTAIFENRKVIEIASVMAAKAFADASVDMVFIDADHVYESVKPDIDAWLPKATKIICGHDFSPSYPGVMQAVKDVFGDKYGLCETIWYVNL